LSIAGIFQGRTPYHHDQGSTRINAASATTNTSTQFRILDSAIHEYRNAVLLEPSNLKYVDTLHNLNDLSEYYRQSSAWSKINIYVILGNRVAGDIKFVSNVRAHIQHRISKDYNILQSATGLARAS